MTRMLRFKSIKLGALSLVFLFTTLLFNGCVCAVNDHHNSLSSLQELINNEINVQGIPALSILIFKNDNIIYEDYFGKANIEKNIKLKEDHIFLAASVSKTITATALMQLYDRGKFDLDSSINEYLPFSIIIPGYSDNITFRMLLTHTSAIADNEDVLDDHYFYNEDSSISLSEFFASIFTLGGEHYDEWYNFHNFAPGEDFEYSNTGSALIAYLVEEISGLDFNTYCRENIFHPLDMNNTHWMLSEINSDNLVRPYLLYNGDYEFTGHYTFTDYPNGGLRTNVQDMFKFLTAYVSGGVFNGEELLKEATVKQILSKQIPHIDDTVGLHWFQMNRKHNLWGHDGGEDGVSTIMAFNQETKTGAIILTNGDDAELEEILEKAYLYGISEEEEEEEENNEDGMVFGDIDGDGIVCVKDAIIVLKHIVGLRNLNEEEFRRADLFNTGKINVGIVIIVLRIITGLTENHGDGSRGFGWSGVSTTPSP